jgi:hypothetical protein
MAISDRHAVVNADIGLVALVIGPLLLVLSAVVGYIRGYC